MRVSPAAVLLVAGVMAGGAGAAAQGLLTKPTIQHATITASVSAPIIAAGGAVTLWADVTPNRSIHIYAEGAKDFTPVSLVLTPSTAVSAGRPKYPRPEMALSPGSTEAVPAYRQTFRIALPVTLAPTARSGDVVTISGAVNYQACDDRLCYPVAVAPVTWKVSVK